MTFPDSAFDVARVMRWLNPLVYVVGVAVGSWAYWLSRKLGYLLVTAYFVLVLFAVFLGPAVNRMIDARWDAQQKARLSPQAQEQFVKEYASLLQKYYPPGQETPATINVKIPFGPIILVSGLWMLAERESRRIAEKNGPPTGSQPFPSE
jgi:hypothetical protein